MGDKQAIPVLDKIYVTMLLIIFGGIVLHAPISVGLGTIFPDFKLLIKSWKEILMFISAILAVVLLIKNKKTKLLFSPILVAIGLFALLHLTLILFTTENFSGWSAGLMIDLRFLLYFTLVYIALKLYPNYQRLFIFVGVGGVLIVLVFAVLQVFVLPADVLKHIGYSKSTIMPYLTVDQNNEFIRINSTLRGPNSIGAYSVIVLALIVAFVSKNKINRDKRLIFIMSILSFGVIVALWASYSRSALIGALFAIFFVLAVANYKRLSIKHWFIGFSVVVALVVGVFAFKDNDFVSNVLLHDNPDGGSLISSNEGHINSISDSLNLLLLQPFGAGVGSTGSASLFGNNPMIIENQYLFIAHESGWLGLLLFVSIFVAIIWELWDYRKDWFELGVLASGLGLAIIGFVLPVWVDDTVSIVWWGLAAIALCCHSSKVKAKKVNI